MAEHAHSLENRSIEVEGLEDVFEAEVEPVEQAADTVHAQYWQGDGMSLKAACAHYQMGASTLRAKIKRGEIPATKVNGANGPEWRVFLKERGLRRNGRQGIQQSASTPQAGLQPGELNRLLDIIEKQSARLEAASGQIGYLQAQLQASEEHIELLTDSQHKAGRLQRFWQWFTRSGRTGA